MTQCDSPNCTTTATTTCDAVAMCDHHAQWTAHEAHPNDGQCDQCGNALYTPGASVYEYNGPHSGTFCQSCYDAGDA